MKNTIKKFLAVALLFALAVAPLPSQTNPPVGGVLSGKDLTAIQVAKIKAETDIAQRKLDDDKSIIENRESAHKMMVHDLAWNSWVLAVVGGIFLCGFFKTKRNKQTQETVRLMVEKGSPVTPEIITALKSKDRSGSRIDPYGHLAWGLILLAVGGGLLVMCIKAGWIVLLIGGAFLILWIVERLSSNSGQSK